MRRGHLKERFALLWLVVSLAGLTVGIFPQLIEQVSLWLEFQYLTVFWTASFVFLLLSVLVFTVVISQLTERSRALAQEVALLSQRLDELKAQKDE